MSGSASMSGCAGRTRSSIVSMVTVVSSCRVVGVDVDVVGREVTTPGSATAISGAEVDVDVDAGAREHRADDVEVDRHRLTRAEDRDAADEHATAIQGEGRAAAAQRGDDPPPV